ncbi:MAG: DUF3426 domain-containing protein [Pseudomonadota bacterium]
MALATQCPHCSTIFRVASDQLKLRGGIVRCGACQEVFDGNATLIDLDAVTPGTTPVPTPEAPPETHLSEAFDLEVAAIEAEQARHTDPIYTLDFDTTFDPFGILPKTALPEPAPLAPAAGEPDFDLDLNVDEDLEPPPAIIIEPEPEPAAEATSGTDPEAISLADALASEPARIEPTFHIPPEHIDILVDDEEEAAPEHEEPEFVKRGRHLEQTGRSRRLAYGFGAGVLLLAAAGQGLFAFRSQFALAVPAAKPALVAACAQLGCRIDLPMQIDAMSIQSDELQLLGGPVHVVTAVLRNASANPQAWPSLELELTDEGDRPQLRRVFAPAEYLPASAPLAKGFAPRSEQTVKLFFALDQVKASGYNLAVFYP